MPLNVYMYLLDSLMYLISLMHGHGLFKNNIHWRFLSISIFGKSFLRNLHPAVKEVLQGTGRSINIYTVFLAAFAIGPHVWRGFREWQVTFSFDVFNSHFMWYSKQDEQKVG